MPEPSAIPAAFAKPSADAVAGGNGARPRVRISIYPGGLSLGAIALERATEQFDFATAERFRSLVEVEHACARRKGFLLEIFETEAQSTPATILFVETLRS